MSKGPSVGAVKGLVLLKHEAFFVLFVKNPGMQFYSYLHVTVAFSEIYI